MFRVRILRCLWRMKRLLRIPTAILACPKQAWNTKGHFLKSRARSHTTATSTSTSQMSSMSRRRPLERSVTKALTQTLTLGSGPLTQKSTTCMPAWVKCKSTHLTHMPTVALLEKLKMIPTLTVVRLKSTHMIQILMPTVDRKWSKYRIHTRE